MIIQVSPENINSVDPQVDSIEVSAELRAIPDSTMPPKQASAFSRWSRVLPSSLPISGLIKGVSWGLGVLSFAGAGLLLANRLKLRQELKKSNLQSMVGLNLEKFAGPWYEVAKFPHPGSTRKVGVMVNYEIVDPLTLRERYLYQEGDSETQEKTHLLHLVDPANPARMQKERRGPLAMNYWVLEVGDDYNYAVIGTPDRRHLWILSRTHQLPLDKYEALTYRLKKQGFAVEELVKVPHHGITVGETAKPVIDTEISSRTLPLDARHAPHKN